MRESERQFRLLVAGVTDYALHHARPERASWRVGTPAPSASRATRADEIIGQHFSRFYTDEDRAAGLPERSLAIAAATGRFEAEAWRVRKDGSQFWANVVIDAIHDEHGKLVGFAKITRDITERRACAESARARAAADWRNRRRWKRSASSPAASPTTSTIC